MGYGLGFDREISNGDEGFWWLWTLRVGLDGIKVLRLFGFWGLTWI